MMASSALTHWRRAVKSMRTHTHTVQDTKLRVRVAQMSQYRSTIID